MEFLHAVIIMGYIDKNIPRLYFCILRKQKSVEVEFLHCFPVIRVQHIQLRVK